MTAASAPQTTGKVLLADIGGTNARFALLADGSGAARLPIWRSQTTRSFGEALGAYLGESAGAGLDAGRHSCRCRRIAERPLRTHQQSLGDRCRGVACRLTDFPPCVCSMISKRWHGPCPTFPPTSSVADRRADNRSRARRSRRSVPARALAWRPAYPHATATSCCRAKAAMRPWPADRRGRTPSSPVCGDDLDMSRPNAFFPEPGWKTFTRRLAALDGIAAAKAPRRRDHAGRRRRDLFDQPRGPRHVLRDARDCRRQSRADAGGKGRRLSLPAAFCVTCPTILPARHFARVLRTRGGYADISNRFRSS